MTNKKFKCYRRTYCRESQFDDRLSESKKQYLKDVITIWTAENDIKIGLKTQSFQQLRYYYYCQSQQSHNNLSVKSKIISLDSDCVIRIKTSK